MLICKTIECPWFSDNSNHYGCHRYPFSDGCHLIKKHDGIRSNQYAIYADSLTPARVQELKQFNNFFCASDEKYIRGRAFFELNPGFIGPNTFVPGDIKS